MTIQSPVRLTIILAITTFVAELVLMFFLPLLGLPSALAYNVLDAFLVTVLIAPALYFSLFRPLTRQIGEAQRAEQALRESERRFREMLENVRLLSVMLDREGHILFCNDFLLSLTGWRREEILGRNWFDLFVPADSELRQRFVDGVKQGAVPGHYENAILTRQGEHRLVAWSNTLLRDAHGEIIGAASLGEDITEDKRAKEEILRLHEQQKLILSSTYEGILGLDTQGRHTFVNEAAARLLGYGVEELVGHVSHSTWHHTKPDGQPYPSEECPIYGAFRDGTVHQVSVEVFWRKDGTSFPVEYTSTPIWEKGQLAGAVVTFHDITERKRLENQLRQAQKLEAIGQLAGGVAHDFNNLLTVIQGNAAFLKRASLTPERHAEAIEEIALAVRRAADLTRQLLAFSRRQEIVRRNLNLNKVLSGLARMLQRLIGEHILLENRYSSETVYIHADEGMMEQVVANLVVNARDAMPEGGHLTISTEAVRVGEDRAKIYPAARPGDFVRLTVSDTGTGIAPEHLPRIFEPFFTTKEVGKGSGLGLATVFGIIHQHDGWIEVESALGAGTRFHMYLPRRSHAAVMLPKPARAPKARGGTEAILLVEDNDGVRAIAQRTLKSYGYQVFEAISGRDALQIWNQNAREIELLLTDMVMPGGMSGLELSKLLLAEKPSLKVVYATGFSAEVTRKDVQFVRGVNFLQKPYHPDELAQLVRQRLDCEP